MVNKTLLQGLTNIVFLLVIRFIIPYLYLPEFMKKYDYDANDSAQMISAIGIAQTIGMIGLGYVGDCSWMNVNVCYSGCMISKCYHHCRQFFTSHIYVLLIICILSFQYVAFRLC